MRTALSTKLAALAVALMMNSALMGGIALVFGRHIDRQLAESRAATVHALEVA